MEYNPQEARKKTSPEQQMIREARNLEYDRKFKKSAEERLNQDNPTPLGVFKVQARDVARKIVNKANVLAIFLPLFIKEMVAIGKRRMLFQKNGSKVLPIENVASISHNRAIMPKH